MPKAPSRRLTPIRQLLEVMATLRAPDGCPWDREQDHHSLRSHAVEEVYELMDAIEAGDDVEMAEELLLSMLADGEYVLAGDFTKELALPVKSATYTALKKELVSRGWKWKSKKVEGKVVKAISR